MRSLAWRIRFVLHLPLLAVVRLSSVRADVDRDIRRQLRPRLDLPLLESYTRQQLTAALRHRPLRTVLYARLRNSGTAGEIVQYLVRKVYPGETAMLISCRDIGPGLFLMHGFATIVTAQRIGTDCQISQQVTIGYSDRGAPPIFGDRVRVGANAVVIGPVVLGDDAVVGAGAVVVHDVPPGKVVGGVPAKVLEGATDRFSALRSAGK
jgi:serine O-acetyltransferase